MRWFEVAVPTQEQKVEAELSISISGPPFRGGELQGRAEGGLAALTDVSIFEVEYCLRKAHRSPAQRTGVQLRAPERAAGERQARLLQRLVGQRSLRDFAALSCLEGDAYEVTNLSIEVSIGHLGI